MSLANIVYFGDDMKGRSRAGIQQRLYRMHRYHHASGRKTLPILVKDWLRLQPAAIQSKVAFVLLTHPVGIWMEDSGTMVYRYGEDLHEIVTFGESA